MVNVADIADIPDDVVVEIALRWDVSVEEAILRLTRLHYELGMIPNGAARNKFLFDEFGRAGSQLDRYFPRAAA